jgi:hypothetical protein
MSWSVSCIGKPEKISQALKDYSNTVTGQSKEEYDKALPHLVGLVEQNFHKSNDSLLINFSASGSGYVNGGELISSSCQIKIEQMYGNLLV